MKRKVKDNESHFQLKGASEEKHYHKAIIAVSYKIFLGFYTYSLEFWLHDFYDIAYNVVFIRKISFLISEFKEFT